MAELLVSVRSRSEAVLAWQQGVGIIDLKEPQRGPLASTSVEVWAEVAQAIPPHVRLSVALGELNELRDEQRDSAMPRTGIATSASRDGKAPVTPSTKQTIDHVACLESKELTRVQAEPGEDVEAHIPATVSFAKVGLSGARSQTTPWMQTWSRWRARLPRTVRPVLVHYADAQRCQSPTLEETRHALEVLQPAALLIDTFYKDGMSVFDAVGIAEIQSLFETAQARRVMTVLAGSLSRAVLPQALDCRPDWIAVRGAVCHGSRRGALDPHRLRDWVDYLKHSV